MRLKPFLYEYGRIEQVEMNMPNSFHSSINNSERETNNDLSEYVSAPVMGCETTPIPQTQPRALSLI
ncbi:hypothetical protein J6590_091883 [Homalodisca vitripennis]|nr:hypothetical protein J6590_008876 [Homalodisca vitripennis]KAG8265580.1 hypothetical protein J6590_091883 [Homalodisca vitripennis]